MSYKHTPAGDHNALKASANMRMHPVLPPVFCGIQDTVDSPHDDLIIRSSDNVDFRVSKHVLSKASAVFSDMCSIPCPPSEDLPPTHVVEEAPVVPITEHSDLVVKFLEYIVSGCSSAVTFENISEIRDFYSMADKYVSDSAMDAARTALAARSYTSPFEVYLTACHLGLEEEARKAARHALRYPLSRLKDTNRQRADVILTPAPERLWSYHEECRSTAVSVGDCEYWAVQDLHVFPSFIFDPRIPRPPSVFSTQPRCCTTPQTGTEIESYYVKTWFQTFLTKLSDLLSAKPSGEDLGFDEWSALYRDAVSQAKQCPQCGEHAFDLLSMYSRRAFARVDSLIGAVSDILVLNLRETLTAEI